MPGIYEGSLEKIVLGCRGRRCGGGVVESIQGTLEMLRGFGDPVQHAVLGTDLWEAA